MKRSAETPCVKRSIRWIGLALVACLAACSDPQPPLRVGMLAWPPYQFAYYAEHLGYFDPERIELVEFKSPAEASRAYIAGGLDVVALTLEWGLDFHARDSRHRAFMVIDESLGGDAVISRDPISDLSDVAGKKVGVENSALGAHMLYRMLERAGLEVGDVDLVYIDIPDHVAAYRAGKADVIVTYEPIPTELVALGGHKIFSSREIPGEIIDVFLARDEDLRSRRDDFRHLTSGWFRAIEAYEKSPSTAVEMMAPGLGMSPADFLAAFDGIRVFRLEENRNVLGGDNTVFFENMFAFARSLKRYGSIQVPEDPSDVFTDEVLP